MPLIEVIREALAQRTPEQSTTTPGRYLAASDPNMAAADGRMEWARGSWLRRLLSGRTVSTPDDPVDRRARSPAAAIDEPHRPSQHADRACRPTDNSAALGSELERPRGRFRYGCAVAYLLRIDEPMHVLTFGRIAALTFFILVVAALAPEPYASDIPTDIVLSDEIADGCRVSSGSVLSPLEVNIHCAPESQPLNVEVIPPGQKSKLSGMKGHDSVSTILIRF